jgi:hypothetical protein
MLRHIHQKIERALGRFWRKYIVDECPDDRLERLHLAIAASAIAKLKERPSYHHELSFCESAASKADELVEP